ncbi:two-component sensor histidine kinase [Bacillus sp. VT 712]|uniref:histidine kinase n=1 Tax=Priestia veravalensis TaxID=1414648 RepID=A0A0V8JJL9_9BACI|nr:MULTISPECIES: sensor histidine kinase [Bacillaceae]KSU87237.1 histidine kinase [Priestia veravalensis]KZB90892.1 two-component sensor histidine kinase [Bacillus sp. VT 712]SCC40250.1 two-component system, OmpR family, sensor histidine kinase CssS [Priestia flexa]
MKNRSLAFQIWLVISGILLVISLLLATLFPSALRQFFTDEIYTSIENEQHILKEYGLPSRSGEYYFSNDENGPSLRNRTVDHILLPENVDISYLSSRVLPQDFLRHAQELAQDQESTVERYEKDLGNRTLFYVISKVIINDQPAFLLSFSWDTYRNALASALFKQLLVVMSIVFLLSWIPSIWLAKYLSRPLVSLERHVKRIAEQEWHESVTLDRTDEIGKLGSSIEQMRQRLIRKEEAQQTLLQNISHDLKTPVMVIRSYAQSIQDGIYPKGDLSNTVQVIEDESLKLEKKIRDLLYLTKLDYLSAHPVNHEPFALSELICEVVERLRWSRTEIQWDIRDDKVTIDGDKEQWTKVIENILENQIRYADSSISISVHKSFYEEMDVVECCIANDGPPIEENVLSTIFEPFEKGSKGEFGIGLSIVKRIVTMHNATISVQNLDKGVSFTIRIPVLQAKP